MPSQGIYKIYVENGYYHVFNRGNNKQPIFVDSQDYTVFFKIFWDLIKTPYSHLTIKKPDVIPLAYCLMPNHFHFMLKQESKTGISNLMKRLAIKYVMYFNKRHQRTGRLFQSIFKAKYIDDDPYLLHVSRYIHLNPKEGWHQPLATYPYSSYATYLGQQKNSLLNTQEILAHFKASQKIALRDYISYQTFVEDFKDKQGTTLEYSFLG